MTLTAAQIRAARAMLRMEQTELAQRSGVSVETIKRLESTVGPLKAQFDTLKNIRTACELAGVDFLDDDKQPGVRLAADRTSAFLKAMTDEIAGIVSADLGIRLRRNPSLIDSPKDEQIKAVLESVFAVLGHTLPNRLPGKTDQRRKKGQSS
jgi:transcriptional regulator with XRE-family HTH domain